MAANPMQAAGSNTVSGIMTEPSELRESGFRAQCVRESVDSGDEAVLPMAGGV